MSSFRKSDGTKVPKQYIDSKVREAKAEKIAQFLEENDYIVCEECNRNDCVPVDCSHNISVDECQKSGRAELAWDLSNFKLRGRKCHREYDKTNLKF